MIAYIDLVKWFKENYDKINDSIVRDVFSVKDGLVLELYKKDLNKKYLYIIPGKIIFLSDKKLEKIKNKFSERLKKEIINKKIKVSIEDDKIIVIESENIKIYSELVPNGLIIVTNNENIILYATKYKDFGFRKIKPGEKYNKPPKNFSIAYNIDEFKKILEKTNKKDIVRFLAIDLGLSGKYAEYLLNSSNIEKSKNPKELSEEEINRIFQAYLELLNKREVLYQDRWYSDINLLFEEIYFKEELENKKKNIERKKEDLIKIIEDQKLKLKEFEKEIEFLNNIANLIKENYWLFEDYNLEKITNFFKSNNFDVLVEKMGNKILIKFKN